MLNALGLRTVIQAADIAFLSPEPHPLNQIFPSTLPASIVEIIRFSRRAAIQLLQLYLKYNFQPKYYWSSRMLKY